MAIFCTARLTPETASDALGQSLPSQANATAPARPAASAKSGAETLAQVVTPKLSVTLERIVEVVARQFAVFSAQDLRTSRKSSFRYRASFRCL